MNPDPLRAGIAVFGVHTQRGACLSHALRSQGIALRPAPLRSVSALGTHRRTLVVCSNGPAWNRRLTDIAETFHRRPRFRWRDRIERVDAP